MKAVVVGATGFLGLNLIEALQSSAFDEVIATRRRSSNTIFLRRLKLDFIDPCVPRPATNLFDHLLDIPHFTLQ